MAYSKRHGEAYSRTELRTIKRMAREGRTSRETAKVVGRTPGALRFAAMTHGISFDSYGKKRLARRRKAR